MASYIYVDNSNIFVAAQAVKAVNEGDYDSVEDVSKAMRQQTFSNRFKIDYKHFYQFLAEGEEVGRCALFGSRSANDVHGAEWENIAHSAGFEIIMHQRNISNREKRVDTAIIVAVMQDAYTKAKADEDRIVLVAGDADYIPLVKTLVEDGFNIKVVSWRHAMARELMDAASELAFLDDHIRDLDYTLTHQRQGERPMRRTRYLRGGGQRRVT